MAGPKPMSPNGEQIAHDVVDREEPLGLCRRLETPHVALAPARRLVGDFGPVVGVASRVVDHGRHGHPVRGTVAPEAIGDQAAGDTAAALEQLAKEPRGGVAIPGSPPVSVMSALSRPASRSLGWPFTPASWAALIARASWR